MIKKFNTKLQSSFIIKADIFKDKRGCFLELYSKSKYVFLTKKIKQKFVQDNFSFSKKNTLRGLHYSKKMGKLVTVIYGKIYDVIVDLNKQSKTYMQWQGRIMSSKDYTQLWIPPGFAHGFAVLSDFACVQYKCTQEYKPSLEKTIIWSDTSLAINWPIKNPILSKKDKNAKSLNYFLKK